MLLFVLTVPLVLAFLPFLIKNHKVTGYINAAGYAVILAGVASIVFNAGTVSYWGFFYVDALSKVFMITIGAVCFTASLYSIGYIEGDLRDKTITLKKAGIYYSLFNLFSFSMLLATAVNNMGMLWVAVELTTLASAFLVGFYNKRESVEAAWKYLIICSAGIALALLGTILMYYTVSAQGNLRNLNWTDVLSVSHRLNPEILKIAFICILAGYGTKAGLAPMHTWLPDAHSQAPAPVSAMLSGVLIKTSLYAILRFAVIVNKACGHGFSNNLFILFGLFSLGLSSAFILVQKDIKRLLAYHSIEHIGIIAVGIGIGGAAGLYGALLHVFNHALTKALMFFGAGNIVRKYGSHNMHRIKGVLQSMPFAGFIIILAVFALGGSPPFSIFISEMIILFAGFNAGSYLTSGLFLLFIAVIFGALVQHYCKMIFGPKPADMPVSSSPYFERASFVFLFIFIVVLGLNIPQGFNRLLTDAAGILKGM
ncbi:MAG: hydrogenase 4 subunit F [Elusimicrobia bacterium]|nr:hydrogenase 4 subunit F [Elusimicrobiota bacterium]